jgi:hypothetical protein
VQQRLDANPEAMRQCRETVEHPFGRMKARMGATHFLTKTLRAPGDWQRVRGETPHGEGVANQIVAESCAVVREGLGEALTGVRIGQVMEPRKLVAGLPAAELVEPRTGTERNAGEQSTHRSQGRVRVTQSLDRVRQAARQSEQPTRLRVWQGASPCTANCLYSDG